MHATALAGLGLKAQHLAALVAAGPSASGGGAAFVEVHAENCMAAGGPWLRQLDRLRERWPLSVHGVGLSIGGEAAPDAIHLERLAAVLERFQPRWFSEHLAWSSHGGHWFNDLLPLPYNRRTLLRVAEHIDQVQARLKRALLLENPSRYLDFAQSTMDEAQFLGELVQRTGCGLLLDVNNAFVSAHNLAAAAASAADAAWAFIDALPAHAVGEIHLAGHAVDSSAEGRGLLIDDHGSPVAPAVWTLYQRTLAKLGPVPTLIERDNDVPALADLQAEAGRAHRLLVGAAASRLPEPQAA
jgi:uncharacterized protein